MFRDERLVYARLSGIKYVQEGRQSARLGGSVALPGMTFLLLLNGMSSIRLKLPPHFE